MKTVIRDIFETNLGNIELTINSEFGLENQFEDKLNVENENYKITVVVVDLNKAVISEDKNIENSKCWRIYIEKQSEKVEKLNVICKLLNPSLTTNWDYSSGESLDAIEIENGFDQLHIGTEDGKVMNLRAENNDWLPVRLKHEISLENPITEYLDFGFESLIPYLAINEKLYLHFLVATKKIEHENNDNISTWLAVDWSKAELDKLSQRYSGQQLVNE